MASAGTLAGRDPTLVVLTDRLPSAVVSPIPAVARKSGRPGDASNRHVVPPRIGWHSPGPGRPTMPTTDSRWDGCVRRLLGDFEGHG